MGWICPRCGAENAFGAARCQACGRRAFAVYRLTERLSARMERDSATQAIEAGVHLTSGGVRAARWGNRVARGVLWIGMIACLTLAIIGAGHSRVAPETISQRLNALRQTVSARGLPSIALPPLPAEVAELPAVRTKRTLKAVRDAAATLESNVRTAIQDEKIHFSYRLGFGADQLPGRSRLALQRLKALPTLLSELPKLIKER